MSLSTVHHAIAGSRFIALLTLVSLAIPAPGLSANRPTDAVPAPRLDRVVAMGLISKKPTQLAVWYTNKFGLRISQIADCGGIFGVLQTSGGPVHLAIFDDERPATQGTCGSHALAHRAIAGTVTRGRCDSRSLFFEVNDFAGYLARLRAAGLEPAAEFDAGGDERAAVFSDPEGRAIGIWGKVAR